MSKANGKAGSDRTDVIMENKFHLNMSKALAIFTLIFLVS